MAAAPSSACSTSSAGSSHELGGPPARGAIRLDDALDRDLGIGSLERVELLLRIEKELGVRLSDGSWRRPRVRAISSRP